MIMLFWRTRDEAGRSVLHMAASLGKMQIIDWLLKYKVGFKQVVQK